ncbi:MAG: chemotaxis protein CheB, partial [Bacteroidetes bacterium]|nr:chemotaxis protein CheB [Bacteroidota bacterium]
MKPDRILVIGGSAGSLSVILSLLSAMGAEFPIPLVIVLHRNNVFESSLEELLSSRTGLEIKEVEEKESLRAG